MKSSALISWLLVALVLAAGYGSFILWRQTRCAAGAAAPVAVITRSVQSASSPAMPAGPVADFVLTDETGHEFDSSSLRGKVWVASFFFTNCPAVCWRMNQALAAWQQTHPDSDVRFISITCDPDNDTPEALARYAAHFKADPQRWTFLTGDMNTIQSIGQDSFKIAVVRGDHTDRACVVDRNGQVRGRFRLTEPDQAEMLDRLLAVVEAEPVEKAAEGAPPNESADGKASSEKASAQAPAEATPAEAAPG